MNRRVLLSMCVSAATPQVDERTPTDQGRLNIFAKLYNEYVLSLNQGIINIRLWRRVQDAWRRLV